MTKYNFDKVVDRKNTQSIKYDFAVERGKPENILPFWVADMDFPCPSEIIEELNKCVNHGIFGYSEVKDDYSTVVLNWFEKHFSYSLEKDWLVKTPGIVFAIATAIKTYTEIGDGVIIQKPVYYPFSTSIKDNDRKLVNNPLVYKDGKYTIDFVDFEKKIVDNNVKLFILCNPHNPIGRVYTKDELLQLGNICKKHGVIIVSDEIHCDFVREGHIHNLFLSVDDSFKDFSVLLTAPSKTFNIAGLQVSNNFIPNKELREKFKKEINKTGYSQLNNMGLIATKAAYEYGEDWLKELKKYLEYNLLTIRNFLEEKLPKIKLVEPEGTYLAWLDFSEYNLSVDELNDLIVNKANLWLDCGTMFGGDGANFQRINYACPNSLIVQLLDNLYSTFKDC